MGTCPNRVPCPRKLKTMRNLQYLLVEQIQVLALAAYGLQCYIQDDMALGDTSAARENFVTDLNAVAKHLEECRRLLLKHAATPSEVVG